MVLPAERRQSALHVIWVRQLCTVVEELGFDAAPVLAAAGIQPQHLEDARRMVSLEQAIALTQAAVEQTQHTGLGLEVAARFDLTVFGRTGVAVATAPTIREALHRWSMYVGLFTRLTTYTLEEDESGGHCRLREIMPLGPSMDMFMAAGLAILLRVLESVGANFAEIQVDIPHPMAHWRENYGQYFRGRMVMGQPDAVVHIPRQVLDKRCVAAHPELFESACHDCDRQLAELCASDVRTQVRDAVLALGLSQATLPRVSARLAMSPRTLARQLGLDGSSYQSIVDDHRKALALWWLKNTERSLSAIALELGFTETTHFSRTFRRWFLETPSTMRRKLRGP